MHHRRSCFGICGCFVVTFAKAWWRAFVDALESKMCKQLDCMALHFGKFSFAKSACYPLSFAKSRNYSEVP